MEEIKVSVLIPVYGVEKYIEQCARSLLEQTMKEGIEFIFVNDCTRDKSIDILNKTLEDYPERKNQVRVINHEKNQGLAIARVTGVKAARGEYVIHCDSDDWVEPDMYELMYQEANRSNADMVGCDFIEEYREKSVLFSHNFPSDKKKAICEILIGRLGSYLWARMIKRSFYLENKFFAPENITMLEDMVVTIPMHLATTNVSKVDKPLYHYRQTSESMSKCVTGEKLTSAMSVLALLKNECTKDEDMIRAYHKALIRFSMPYITTLNNYNPKKWRSITSGIPIRTFGSFGNLISPILIRLHLDIIKHIYLIIITKAKTKHS